MANPSDLAITDMRTWHIVVWVLAGAAIAYVITFAIAAWRILRGK